MAAAAFWRANPFAGSKEQKRGRASSRRSGSSWRAPKTEDLRRELRELKDELKAAKQELRECDEDSRREKEKHFSVTDTLEKQKNHIKQEYETRREELRESEKQNFTMREDLAKQKLALKNETKTYSRLVDQLKHVQMRDQSNFYKDSRRDNRYRTPGADKEKAIEEATEKCDKLRELVLRRWQYREKIRKANIKIGEVKLKKQTIRKELGSIETHEKELVRIAVSLKQGIEALTAEATIKGTTQNSTDLRNEDINEKVVESTERLEEMLRGIPHEFERLEESQGGKTAVNEMYHWLLTDLLQKIGLVYIGFNHQLLMAKGYRMDYRDLISSLKLKKYKLMNEIDIIEEQQRTKQENAEELIPQLKEDIARLKRNRETVTKQFEDYKKRKIEIENDILRQQKDIDNSASIEDTYSKLCREVEELRGRIDKTTDKMNRGGRQAISSLAYDSLRDQGYLDDDEPSESVDHRQSEKRPREGKVTRGGPSRDDEKWGGEYSDDEPGRAPVGRSRAPVGHSSPKRSISRSPSPDVKPRHVTRGGRKKTRGGSSYSDEEWGSD